MTIKFPRGLKNAEVIRKTFEEVLGRAEIKSRPALNEDLIRQRDDILSLADVLELKGLTMNLALPKINPDEIQAIRNQVQLIADAYAEIVKNLLVELAQARMLKSMAEYRCRKS